MWRNQELRGLSRKFVVSLRNTANKQTAHNRGLFVRKNHDISCNSFFLFSNSLKIEVVGGRGGRSCFVGRIMLPYGARTVVSHHGEVHQIHPPRTSSCLGRSRGTRRLSNLLLASVDTRLEPRLITGCLLCKRRDTDEWLLLTAQGTSSRRVLKRLLGHENWEKGFLRICVGIPTILHLAVWVTKPRQWQLEMSGQQHGDAKTSSNTTLISMVEH